MKQWTNLPSCRRLPAWLAAAVLLGGAVAAGAQSYPSRPVRFVVPSLPGGGTDITARLIAPKITEILKQQVVIDNRGGAGTMIGSEHVARSAPDGYTVLLPSVPMAINPAMYRKVPYDALRDFAHVTQISSLPNMLVTHPSLPVKNVKELVAFAKARPGQLSYASAGIGTGPHLFMELFFGMTGLNVIHVPYKGSGPGVIDVIAGHVPLMAPLSITGLGYVRDGRLRALGVTSDRRMSAAPEIPTIAEAGVPGYEASNWIGMSAPAGTPREIIGVLHSAIVKALQLPDIRSRLIADGAEPVGNSPEAFAAYIRSETEKWAKVVKSAGIKPE
jgi:tripartite-type tricarboxylate transporter receptor subunit TctC